MSRVAKKRVADVHQQEVDEIIAACRGDLRGAVTALLLINERLEETVQALRAGLMENSNDQPRSLLH
jgi:hypothetical protein